MKVLQIHNAYRLRGGEDSVVAAEAAMLRDHGAEVRLFGSDNATISGPWSQLTTAWRAPYSVITRRRLEKELAAWRPDVIHVHNLFPLLTPAVFDATRAAGIPSVMTLHNFRWICPGALLWRQGRPCEDCLGTAPWRAVVHRCYRRSLLGSLAVARMVDRHRRRGTWQQKVDRFIVMTEFAKSKFLAAGWEGDRIAVKPHSCPLPDPAPEIWERHGALFAGRLSEEKGVATLLDAWRQIPQPLRLAGEGPLAAEAAISGHAYIQLLGWLSREALAAEMQKSVCLVVPSECLETFGMVVIEAFAQGLPVVASRLGALSELIEDGVTGLLFSPGDASSLASKVRFLLENPDRAALLGRNARGAYAARYTPARNFQKLLQIYQDAISGKKTGSRPEY